MKNIIKKTSFLKDFAYMGLGTIVSQLISVLVQPILTRIVPAETLGISTFLISLANLIIPVATLKMEMLIVSEKNEREAQYLTDVCIWVNTIISFIYFMIIVIGFYIAQINVFTQYGLVIFLVPFLVFMNGLRFLFISYNNRYKDYLLIANVSILREFFRAIIQIISGFLKFGITGQVLSYGLSPLFGMNLSAKLYKENKKNRIPLNIDKFKEIIFTKGKHQILYLVPGQFINSFSSTIITLTISTLFTAKTLGLYSASVRLLDVPILFITTNINKVLYQRFSEHVGKKLPIESFLKKSGLLLSIISLIGFGLLFYISPILSEFVFGKGYYLGGIYIQNLCLMYGIRMVTTSFNGLFTIFEKQKYELFINIVLVLVAVLSLITTKSMNYEIGTYLKFINYGYSVVYLILLFGYWKVCYDYDKKLQLGD